LTIEYGAKIIRGLDARSLLSSGEVWMSKSLQTLLGPILLGGFIAGTIDIGAAAMINAVNLQVILKAIAGGILGKAAFEQGIRAEILGLFLQWGMSLLIAAIFVITASRVNILRRQWVAAGLAYGVGIFFVMNYMVVPQSAIGHAPHFTIARFIENLLAMLLFGLIIAFFARSAPESGRPLPTAISGN
jgi:predicted neutral ceramidase superfamily lipid hydrolase